MFTTVTTAILFGAKPFIWRRPVGRRLSGGAGPGRRGRRLVSGNTVGRRLGLAWP